MRRAILKLLKVLAYLSLDLIHHLKLQSKKCFRENVPLSNFSFPQSGDIQQKQDLKNTEFIIQYLGINVKSLFY
jgi:hypothetical protein